MKPLIMVLHVAQLASRSGRPTETRIVVSRFAGSVPAPGSRHWAPAADLYETPTDIVIDVNLAGIQSTVVRIEMTPRLVKLTGHRAEQQKNEPISFHLIEIERGAFERTFQLPVPIQPRGAQVNYNDGMLNIRLPKVSGGFFHACAAGSNEDFE